MNGEKSARVLAGLAVLAVAVVAFIVSFAHIETLALASGYSIATARLLPFSVDGLILASSTALLTGARTGLARAGLVLGIVATLGANVAAGAEFGVVGALVNAWPAVAFIVASEILLSTVRAARDLPSAEGAAGTVAAEAPTAPVLPLEAVAGDVLDAPQGGPLDVDAEEDTDADTAPAKRTTTRRTTGGQSTADKVATLRARHPDMTQAQMAARLKVSERTVRRHLAAAAADTMHEATPVAAL